MPENVTPIKKSKLQEIRIRCHGEDFDFDNVDTAIDEDGYLTVFRPKRGQDVDILATFSEWTWIRRRD